MKKALEITQEISDALIYDIENQFDVKISSSIRESDQKEFFSIENLSKLISIKTSTPFTRLTALHQLYISLKTSSLKHYLGENLPLYDLRILWFHGDRFIKLTENFGVYLPDWLVTLKKNKITNLAQRILELGYNSVILGADGECIGSNQGTCSPTDLSELCAILREFGIKVILKPILLYDEKEEIVLTPFCETLQGLIQRAFRDLLLIASGLYGVFWKSLYEQSDFQLHPLGRSKTKEDKTLAEILLLEKELLNLRLIYYLPCKDEKSATTQMEWISNLMNHTGKNTLLACSFVAGDPKNEYLKAHPWIELLEKTKKYSSTPLLPIFNTGSVDLGKGLWPNVCFDYETFFSFPQSLFFGAIHQVSSIPRQGSLLDCALWIMGQKMWKNISFDVLFKIWFSRYYPELDPLKYITLLKQTRRLIVELKKKFSMANESKSDVDSEELKVQASRFFAECKEIEYSIKKLQPLDGTSSYFKEQYRYFLRDARNLMRKILLAFDIAIPQNDEGEDRGDGFWVSADLKTALQLFDLPHLGEVGKASHRIFWESTIEID